MSKQRPKVYKKYRSAATHPNQDHKLHTKEFFIIWTKNSVLSNASKFLSFHTFEKIHIGTTFQDFLQALPTKEPCHPRSVSLTE